MSNNSDGYQPKRKYCPRCPADTSFSNQIAIRKHWGRIHKGCQLSELEESLNQQIEDCPFCTSKNSRKIIVIDNILQNNLCWFCKLRHSLTAIKNLNIYEQYSIFQESYSIISTKFTK